MTKTRSQIAGQEATRDPIFLFQRRSCRASENAILYGHFLCPDCEGVFKEPEADHHQAHGDDDFDDPGLGWKELVEMGYLVETWQTERVFLTREGGERYGEARSYNYPEGWRVYCIPADGYLADLLLFADFAIQGGDRLPIRELYEARNNFYTTQAIFDVALAANEDEGGVPRASTVDEFGPYVEARNHYRAIMLDMMASLGYRGLPTFTGFTPPQEDPHAKA